MNHFEFDPDLERVERWVRRLGIPLMCVALLGAYLAYRFT